MKMLNYILKKHLINLSYILLMMDFCQALFLTNFLDSFVRLPWPQSQGNRMKRNEKYVIIDQKELVNYEKVFRRINGQQTTMENQV